MRLRLLVLSEQETVDRHRTAANRIITDKLRLILEHLGEHAACGASSVGLDVVELGREELVVCAELAALLRGEALAGGGGHHEDGAAGGAAELEHIAGEALQLVK